MCLILFAWQAHPRYPLIVAANREEFHQRPTAAAAFWEDSPELLAGRDLQAGGTWLGVTRSGRFAAITNYREPLAPDYHVEMSRGHLVRDFLLDRETGEPFVSEVNTIPGFTDVSMYPRLWEATGLGYADLLARIIDLGLERHRGRQRLRRTVL